MKEKISNMLNEVKNNKLKMAGIVVTVAGLIVNYASSAIETKNLENLIDDRFDAKIASMVDSDEEEEAQNE